METPLVSVIIPNYNHAPFLDERIQSVLNQTYQNFELIILDDKSTDNSVEIINKYKDNQHVSHIVVNEENSGSPFKQWHKGFDLAKGEWIWIAESDDSCKAEFLKTLIEKLDENVTYAFCKSTRIDENGMEFHECWQDNLDRSFNMSGSDFYYTYLGYRNVIWNASSVLFRKSNIYKLPDQYTKYRGAGDWMFWILLSMCGNVVYIKDILNYFRLHSENTTQKTYSTGLNQIEQCQIYDYLLEHKYITPAFYNEIRHKELVEIFLYSKLNNSIKKRILKQWRIRPFEILLLKFKKLFIEIFVRISNN